MAVPSTRESFKSYCLRRLGEPVIDVNVDDEQVEDRIDEALQFYQEYHADATIRRYRKHTVTGTDVTNKYIELPETFLSVTRVLPFDVIAGSPGLTVS